MPKFVLALVLVLMLGADSFAAGCGRNRGQSQSTTTVVYQKTATTKAPVLRSAPIPIVQRTVIPRILFQSKFSTCNKAGGCN